MRAGLSIALIVAFATTAHAQERAQPEPVNPAPTVEVQTERAPVHASVSNEAQRTGGDAATTQPADQQRAAETVPVRQDGPQSRSWWWLVGAIVLAGIILVAIT